MDAAFYHVHGIVRQEVECIMETFPIVKKDEKEWGSTGPSGDPGDM